ncbi:hypothetical protein JOF29_002948 [Kribbella aluminosa]|uniref:DUF4832 domain-containing protein n=1 Tax=Kribbella aluminosa TaxID=416017 RepID=A0ABS4UJR6_9ACTN|nr:DUF4832 domain-containing protein [Kribbella aluminosa]MBP2351865.1 hypothetical protein [Kribbella aluminosa]
MSETRRRFIQLTGGAVGAVALGSALPADAAPLSPGRGRGPRASTTATYDLTPLWDQETVLVNPHKGWYQHYLDDRDNSYLGTVAELQQFPGMNQIYIRIAWSFLEPVEGQYDWHLIDDAIAQFVPAGFGVSFRITCRETGREHNTPAGQLGFATPTWLNDLGMKGTYICNWGSAGPGVPAGPTCDGTLTYEPDYGDPIFLEKLENFHRAFAARYADKPWVRYIDIGSYGDWGESHTTWSGSGRVWPVSVIKEHIDIHKRCYPNNILLAGDELLWRPNDTAGGQEIRQYVKDQGVSWRDDSILIFFNPVVQRPELFDDVYLTRPTVLECQHYPTSKRLGYWQGQDGSVRGATDLIAGIRGLHASYIGFHGNNVEWLTDNPNLTKQLANLCGYWYFPASISLPATAHGGETVTAQVAWENHGVAPAYNVFTPYLQFVAKQQPAAGKRCAASGPIRLSGSNNRSWIPDQQTMESYSVHLPALPAGTYSVQLALIEEAASNRHIALGLAAGTQTADKYYTVGEITIS